MHPSLRPLRSGAARLVSRLAVLLVVGTFVLGAAALSLLLRETRGRNVYAEAARR